MHYGFLKKILSDQGCNFESELITELCELSNIKKLRTTPYRPQYNGQCEHFNSTLISMIGTLPINAKVRWQKQVPPLVHAYTCSHSNMTGFSPYYLMYGRQPMLPTDVEFGVRTPDIVASTSQEYIQKLQKSLKWAYKIAQETSKKELEHSKRRYDQNIKCTKLEIGDLVLVRQKTFKGKHKISDRWKNNPYIIIQCVNEHLLVYKVQLVEGDTKIMTLHRNCYFL